MILTGNSADIHGGFPQTDTAAGFQMPVEGCHKLVSPFRVSVSEHDSQMCSAAIQLFNDGKTNVDDLVAGLIEMFPAPDLLKSNAPTVPAGWRYSCYSGCVSQGNRVYFNAFSTSKRRCAMANAKIPKKIAGYKVPKGVRKNSILKTLLASPTGRDILGKALIAGAGAAAAVLIEDSDDIAGAAKSGTRKGTKALGLVGRAFHSATDAAVDVVRDAASSALPKKIRKRAEENPRKGVAVH
ncbi:hypothetical protein [Rhizobium binae]|uniref:hypothetical protein n=1 Tax=Rhizobium binae TaxID=1138190 RepID=UPI001FEFED39|nr:hypothetical protein [Rhizobium binae]